MAPVNLDDPIAVLLAASEALEGAGIPAAAYGGLALAVYGEPRETRDADLAIAGASAPEVAEALAGTGVQVTTSFEWVRFGGHRVTRFALIGGGALNTVDLVEPRAAWFAELALQRSMVGTLRDKTLAVLSPEDFVLFKVLSTRERDLEDARTVVAALAGALDLVSIEADGQRLAGEITDHDVAGRLAAVLGSG